MKKLLSNLLKGIPQVWILLFRQLARWDWKVLLLCMALSFVLWVFRALNDEHTTQVEVPLQVVPVSEKPILSLRELPEHLQANVTGNGWGLLYRSLVGMDTLVLRVDQPLQTHFATQRQLLPYVAELGKNFQVNSLATDTLFFDFDTLGVRNVPLALDTAEIVYKPLHYRVSPYQISPASIQVKGPSRLLSQLPSPLYLRPRIHGVGKDVDAFFPIFLPKTKEALQELKPSQGKARLQFHVIPYREETVPGRFVFEHFPKALSNILQHVKVQVRYELPANSTDMPELPVPVYLNYRKINWKDSTLVPKAYLPAPFRNLRIEPDRIKIHPKR